MTWLVGRGVFLVWRIVQLWTFFGILVLETVRASQNSIQYWLHPQTGIWISEGVSFIIIGYMLVKFNQRWKTGNFREDVVLDWILFATWFLQIVLNTAPSTISTCEINSYDTGTGTSGENAGCRLFLGSAVLSFFAFFTVIVTLIFSITRWKNNQNSPSSYCDYDIHCRLERPYVVKKGLLDNGEPALFFYSKNTSNRVYEKSNPKLKNIFSKTSSVSPLPHPISISIPEPEIAATAKHVKDIPDVDVIVDEEKNDDLTLKY